MPSKKLRNLIKTALVETYPGAYTLRELFLDEWPRIRHRKALRRSLKRSIDDGAFPEIRRIGRLANRADWYEVIPYPLD